jgi:tetratricopeptide (TPR) repeat protein
MNKDLGSEAIGMHTASEHSADDYRPAIDEHARELITRIQRDHRDTDAVLALQAHYETHNDYPSLANLMEGWAAALRDDRKAADAYVQAAEAVLTGLADRERALSLYQRGLARFPEHELALAKLEGLLTELGDYTDLERCLTVVARDLERREAKPELRADVHYRLGQLYERRLLLLGRAIGQYRSALDLDPTLTPAIAAARGIYLRSGKAQAAADMYELQIAVTKEVWERHGLLLALAKHRREQLADVDGALLALRRALKAVPAEISAIELLAELLRERGERGEGATPNGDRVRAAELYYQLACEVPRQGARKHLEACLSVEPSHPRALRMLAEIDADGPQPGASPKDIDDDLAAWLDDKEVTAIEESTGTQKMVPITDRPPPPEPISSKKLRARMRRLRPS